MAARAALHRCPTGYPTWVNKTSVYLSTGEANRLAALAKREGTSQSEVIRRAIRTYEPQGRGDRDFSLAGSGAGSGRSIADETEADLLEGFGA